MVLFFFFAMRWTSFCRDSVKVVSLVHDTTWRVATLFWIIELVEKESLESLDLYFGVPHGEVWKKSVIWSDSSGTSRVMTSYIIKEKNESPVVTGPGLTRLSPFETDLHGYRFPNCPFLGIDGWAFDAQWTLQQGWDSCPRRENVLQGSWKRNLGLNPTYLRQLVASSWI